MPVSLPTECGLCPRACNADRAGGISGVCGADDGLRIARAALHEWEEPCISVGAGSGTVFFSGCPLRCRYCQNYDISLENRGRRISVERLADIFFELVDGKGAANVNLVTGTPYIPYIVEAVARARARGLTVPMVWNTSGYESVSALRSLSQTVDIYLTDLKYPPDDVSDAARRYSHAPDYFPVALSAIDEMYAQTGNPVYADNGSMQSGVIVRHLLLPGRLADSRYVVKVLWERYGTRVLYSLMSQYTPIGDFPDMPELALRIDPSEYEALLDFADSLGMEDYFWQDGNAAEESFIPPFDETGVLPSS